MLSRAAVAVCLAISLGSVAFGDIVTLDYPGAALTVAAGINDKGQIVGSYELPGPCPPFGGYCPGGAFLYSNGAYSTINGPGLIGWLYPNGINDAGQIVGFIGDQAVLDTNGVLTFLSAPGYPAGASGINNLGDIVGYYTTFPPGNGVKDNAFIYGGGIMSTINGLPDSVAYGINDNGQFVAFLTGQGAMLYSNGASYPISVPGSTSTIAYGINDAGEIVGSYYDQSGIHGFWDINGVYSTLDVPGATQTYAYGVNNSGQIVGYYVDANGSAHGFLDTPVPEPSSILLLGSATGLLAFAGLRRKRRAA